MRPHLNKKLHFFLICNKNSSAVQFVQGTNFVHLGQDVKSQRVFNYRIISDIKYWKSYKSMWRVTLLLYWRCLVWIAFFLQVIKHSTTPIDFSMKCSILIANKRWKLDDFHLYRTQYSPGQNSALMIADWRKLIWNNTNTNVCRYLYSMHFSCSFGQVLASYMLLT